MNYTLQYIDEATDTSSHVLRQIAQEVTEFNEELQDQIRQAFDIMYRHKGIGLAATQIGVLKRFFVMNATGRREELQYERVFVNPVLKNGRGRQEFYEGCLSQPGLRCHVRRFTETDMEACDLHGPPVMLAHLTGLEAAIAQHEVDHLNGKLFTDRASPAGRRRLQAQRQQLQKLHGETTT